MPYNTATVAVAKTTNGQGGRPRIEISEQQLLTALDEVRFRHARPLRLARMLGVSVATLLGRWGELGFRVFYSAAVSAWMVETLSDNGSPESTGRNP